MKTCLSTLMLFLAASTAVAQFVQTPDPNPPAADKDKEVAADKDKEKEKDAAGARAGGPAGRRANVGQGAQGAARGPAGPMSNPIFDALDTDGDGMITKKELRSAAARLKALDTDGDGNISLAEASPNGMAAGPMGPAAAGGQFGDPNQMIASLMQNDRNNDGKLTADELPGQMAQQMIQQGDKDGDGALSKDELTAAMQQGMQNGAGNWPGGPGNVAGGQNQFQGGGMNPAERQAMGQWLQWDRNGDGMLGANEVPQQAAGMLRGGDINNDGLISPAELKMLMERNGERMRNVRGRAQNDANDADKDAKDAKADDGKKRDRRNARDT